MAVIETFTATGSESSKTFSGIPQLYTYLRLMVYGRSQAVGTSSTLLIQVNGDTTASNYVRHALTVTNTTVAGAYTTADQGFPVAIPGAGYATTADAGLCEAIFHYYRNTSFWKDVHLKHNHRTADSGAGTNLYDFRGKFKSTSAITSLTVADSAANNFLSGTIITLEAF